MSYSLPVDQKSRLINISSIPLRSPFRYPGGKTWLVPLIRRWLGSQLDKPRDFIEPFAGGAIISLTVAFEDLASHITMAELDKEIVAVWQTILGKQAKTLANRISEFDLTPSSAEQVLSSPARSQVEIAFQTILKNRVNYGGVIAGGAGRLKKGDGKGIKSRWYPETLSDRILQIHDLCERITFIPGDGLKVMRELSNRKTCIFFLDPPYVLGEKGAGMRLYNHNQLDHSELFEIASKLKGDFLMTYENSKEIKRLANTYGFETKLVSMKNGHHDKMTELLIGRDLEWASQSSLAK